MSIIELIIFTLLNFGISNGIAHSSLSDMIWRRTFLKKYCQVYSLSSDPTSKEIVIPPKFFTCVMCLSFWSGVVTGRLYCSPTGWTISDGFVASAACWIIYLFIKDKQNET